jgi:hypothetical protein
MTMPTVSLGELPVEATVHDAAPGVTVGNEAEGTETCKWSKPLASTGLPLQSANEMFTTSPESTSWLK